MLNKPCKTLMLAHRGESLHAPENTLAAINIAWQQNADGVEIDVHLSKDNEIVVIHDKTTKRTAGVYKLIKAEPLNILKQLDVGKFKGEQWRNEKIPTLKEVLNTVPDGKYLFIEVKCGAEILPELKKNLKDTHLRNYQIKLIGFDIKTISLIKKNLKQYEVYWVKRINGEKIILSKSGWNRMIEKAKQNELDGLHLSYSRIINKNIVEKIHSNRLKLFVWTINDISKAYRMVNYKVDGILSDKISWIRKRMDEA